MPDALDLACCHQDTAVMLDPQHACRHSCKFRRGRLSSAASCVCASGTILMMILMLLLLGSAVDASDAVWYIQLVPPPACSWLVSCIQRLDLCNAIFERYLLLSLQCERLCAVAAQLTALKPSLELCPSRLTASTALRRKSHFLL